MPTDAISDLFRLTGRHAIVAGGAGLLGSSFAQALLMAGARVTTLDLSDERLARNARDLASYRDLFRPVLCDLTDERAVERAVAAAERVAPLDILINAAALDAKADASRFGRHVHTFVEHPLELWRRTIDANLTSIFLVTQAVCRRFETRARGVVVNISSIYGMVGPDQRIYRCDCASPPMVKPADYSVTKAGLIGFTRYLAAYYAGTQVRVNCLTLGGVFNGHDAAFTEAYSARTLLGRMADRRECWGAVVFLCSEASSYMTGANLVVDGGWTAL